jgi:hypothetical protein
MICREEVVASSKAFRFAAINLEVIKDDGCSLETTIVI